MHPYIVTVVTKRRCHEWLFRNREFLGTDWVAYFPESLDKVDADYSFDASKPVGMTTTFCRNLAEATAHAQLMAKLHPDQEVHVSQVVAVAVSVPAKPVVSKVTEKGVVPQ